MAGSFGPSWSVQTDVLDSATASFGPSWAVQTDVLGSSTASFGPSWVVTLSGTPPQIGDLRTRQIRGLVGLGDWPQRLASTNNINLMSVAGTLMFTVPTDPSIYGYYLTDVIIRADLSASVTAPPTIAIGTANGTSNVVPPTVLTGLTTQGNYYLLRANGTIPLLVAGTTIYFNVTVAATGTAANGTFLTSQVELLGLPVVS